MIENIFIGLALLSFSSLSSAYEWSERPDLRDYVRSAYPEVDVAIKKNGYAELASFEHKLNLGLNIGLNYSSSTSLSGALLIGAWWQIPTHYRPIINFSFADLSFANLAGADLSACDLSSAKLRHADLRGAIINSENIRGADFSGADIRGATMKIKDRTVPLTRRNLKQFHAVMQWVHTSLYPQKECHKSWECHWFPRRETKSGGDPINNLYAEGGALDKLDRTAQSQSRKYEFEHNRHEEGDKEAAWLGHNEEAVIVATILPTPQQSVVFRDIKFSPIDIQGLLVKAIPHIVGDIDVFFDQASKVDTPESFLYVVKELNGEGGPFVLSTDGLRWSFACDSVKFQKTKDENNNTMYEFKFAKPGIYNEHILKCFIKRDLQGNVIESGWIGSPPSKLYRPRPIGDIYEKSTWQRRHKSDNPLVNLEIIYEIYMASLGRK